jgi:retron-type reverse transcriptase
MEAEITRTVPPNCTTRGSYASACLGLPSWSDKLVGEVVRLLLEAIYEPVFSDQSHGFRKGRGCHTALREIRETWTGTVWFIEGDISDCLDPWSYCSFADCGV